MTDLTIVLRGTERVSELNGLLPSKARICRFTLEIGVHIEFQTGTPPYVHACRVDRYVALTNPRTLHKKHM